MKVVFWLYQKIEDQWLYCHHNLLSEKHVEQIETDQTIFSLYQQEIWKLKQEIWKLKRTLHYSLQILAFSFFIIIILALILSN